MVSAMSRAILQSWVEPEIFGPVVQSAMKSLLANVNPNGLLDGVSYETFPMSLWAPKPRRFYG
jgi:hypothetical protein